MAYFWNKFERSHQLKNVDPIINNAAFFKWLNTHILLPSIDKILANICSIGHN